MALKKGDHPLHLVVTLSRGREDATVPSPGVVEHVYDRSINQEIRAAGMNDITG